MTIEPLVLWAFSPVLSYFSHQKEASSLQNKVFLERRKADRATLGVKNRLKTPKTAKMPAKQGKTQQDPQGLASNEAKMTVKLGKNQRAENRALDPWSLDLRFWGVLIFSSEGFGAI